ncbi:MAG: hypothetical protein Q9160_004307 [Pyrenula sp. 1 TL-2023]
MSTPETETTLSIPSLLFVAAISFFAIRYFFSSRSSDSSDARGSGGGGQQINPAHLEQISQMFPDLDRRSIMWDLRRNGGNVAATVERVMQGRGLDRPPPSFQPILSASSPPSTSPSNPNAQSSPSPPPHTSSSTTTSSSHPDLITRYNLHSRVSASDKGKAPIRDDDPQFLEHAAEQGGGSNGMRREGAGSWGKTREERAEALTRRRDEMILRARRRMLDRGREEGDADGGDQSG